MSENIIKNIGIKFVGSKRPAENLSIQPGTTCRDVLQTLGLGTDFALTDPNQPDAVFNAADNLFARVNDGDMLACSAMVDAGWEYSNAH